jgi:hypothetical protein
MAAIVREPYRPTSTDWRATYEMLCGFCERQLRCSIVEAMIGYARGEGPWPDGGWATDPGAEVTCLSYVARPAKRLPRQQLRQIRRLPEDRLPPVCGGCAARRGSEASTSLHTQRDYAAAVRNRSAFTCHEDPARARLCGGWCRAIRQRTSR